MVYPVSYVKPAPTLVRWLERIGNRSQGWHNFFRHLMFTQIAAAIFALKLDFGQDVFEPLPT